MAGSSEWEGGRQVGIQEGRIREQERIIQMIQQLELTVADPFTQEVRLVEMDWGDLFENIRNEEG
jgi:uncharacterized protein YjlB